MDDTINVDKSLRNEGVPEPKNLPDAYKALYEGQNVSVAAIFPLSENDQNLIEEGLERSVLQHRVQQKFNTLSKTINSTEYAEGKRELEEILKDVKGQTFVFDIEGTFAYHLDSDNSSSPENIKVPIPEVRMVTLIKELAKNNKITLYTTANAQWSNELIATLPESLRGVQMINSDVFIEILTVAQNCSNERDFATVMNKYNFLTPHIFDILKEFIKLNGDNFESLARTNKLPQLLSYPSEGIFIDDSQDLIESATRSGWPENKSIKVSSNPSRKSFESVLTLASEIASKVKEDPKFE